MALVSVFATFKEFLTQLPKFLKYLWTGVGESVYQLSVFLFIAATALAVISLENPERKNSAGPFNSVVFVNLGSNHSSVADGPKAAFEIPFFIEPERCPAADGDWGRGTDPGPNAEDFIRNLTRGLSACATGGKAVAIRLHGYASSRAFKENRCRDDSDTLNWHLADARAHKVAELIKKYSGSTITVNDTDWTSSQDMKRGMRFNDQYNDKNIEIQRGDLTRRVDLIVEDAGDCAVASDQGR